MEKWQPTYQLMNKDPLQVYKAPLFHIPIASMDQQVQYT